VVPAGWRGFARAGPLDRCGRTCMADDRWRLPRL